MGADATVSRRELLGAALPRLIGERYAGEPGSAPAPPPVRTAREHEPEWLGAQLAPVADDLLLRMGLRDAPPAQVLVVGAGEDTPLVTAAADLGHTVTSVRSDPPAGASFDAVLAWFAATCDPDPRALARSLRAAAAPGASIALAARRPSEWSRYETAYRHFHGCPALDVVDGAVEVTDRGMAVRLDYALVVACGRAA